MPAPAASVPLYDLFCRVTGYGGTTQTAETLPEIVSGPPIEVSFNADHEPGLPWSFRPAQRSVEVLPGAWAMPALPAATSVPPDSVKMAS